MPLVVPGLTSNSGDNDQTNKWMNDLVGKKLGDSSNETVRYTIFIAGHAHTARSRHVNIANEDRLSPKRTSPRSTV
jgi:hypothetical protein